MIETRYSRIQQKTCRTSTVCPSLIQRSQSWFHSKIEKISVFSLRVRVTSLYFEWKSQFTKVISSGIYSRTERNRKFWKRIFNQKLPKMLLMWASMCNWLSFSLSCTWRIPSNSSMQYVDDLNFWQNENHSVNNGDMMPVDRYPVCQ